MRRCPKAHLSYRSRRIEQSSELALIVIADFLHRERVFTLAEQQELIGPHPHDFVGHGEPAGRDMSADAFRRPAWFSPHPMARDVLTVSYSIVVSPIVRESMSAVA